MSFVFDKEKWQKELKDYKHKIETNNFLTSDTPEFMQCLCKQGMQTSIDEVPEYAQLISLTPKIIKQLAFYYKVPESSVLVGDFKGGPICPYSIIIGNLISVTTTAKKTDFLSDNKKFESTDLAEAKNLKAVIGNITCNYTKRIVSFPQLEVVTGTIDCDYSNIADIRKLKFVGGNAQFRECFIKNFNANFVGGYMDFYRSELTTAENIEVIGTGYNIDQTPIKEENTKKIKEAYIETFGASRTYLNRNSFLENTKQQTQKKTFKNKLHSIKERILGE